LESAKGSLYLAWVSIHTMVVSENDCRARCHGARVRQGKAGEASVTPSRVSWHTELLFVNVLGLRLQCLAGLVWPVWIHLVKCVVFTWGSLGMCFSIERPFKVKDYKPG